MNRSLTAVFAFSSALWCACPSEPVKPPPPPPIDECAGLAPMAVTADPPAVRVNSAATLTATGGSGHYTFTLAAGGSGGELRSERYISGPTPGTDTVTAADDCGNSATVMIEARAAFSVAPARAVIKPRVSFQVATTGTIGTATFTAMQLLSGGTISGDGLYTAGGLEGLDLIVVRDTGTGEEALLQYTVKNSAAFRAAPAKLALPTGASVPLAVADGSGEVSWRIVMGPGAVSGSTFTADATMTGVTLLEGKDRFTNETAPLAIRVLDELGRGGRPHGRVTDVAAIVTGDFDGDGLQDVAVGAPESDLSKPQGGAVFIFRGAAGGLPSAPTWKITGTTDTSNLGAVLAAGDLDGDGKDDLVVSEPGADVTVTDSGAVRIYRFTADGPRPMRDVLTGLGSGRFGASLAVVDVDGDGDNDLVVGSPNGDLAPTATVNQRGVVDIFLLQKGVAIPDLGNIRLGGWDLLGDGTFKVTTQVRYGRALAVGDLNGDGRADLAWLGTAGAPQGDGGTRSQNAVAVHFGRASATKPFLDQPDAYVFPANLADADEGTVRLGVVPASEGKPAFLLVTLDRADSPNLMTMGGAVGGSNGGGAYLFDLSALKPTGATPAAMPTLVQRTDAFARLYGDAASIQAGRSFAVANVDGQPGLELVLGAPYASAPGTGTTTLGSAGKLLVYPLAPLVAGTVANKPADFRGGANRADVLGTAVAPWSSGGTSGLIALAHRATTSLGDFTGRIDGFSGTGPLASWSASSAEVPARLASEQFGLCIKVGEVNGKLRALVGAPGFSGPDPNFTGNDTQVGQAVVYEQGLAQSVVVHEGSTSTYTPDGGRPRFGGRAVGYDVAMTDFDGDGRKDLVVAAPGFVTPSPTSPDYAPFQADAGCTPSSAVGVGGAVVHLAQSDGTFKEGFRVWAPQAIAGCTGTAAQCTRSALSRTGLTGGFDFNHDGKQDLALTRTNGLEIILGRAPQDASLAKLTMACDPAFSLGAITQSTYGPVPLGDLDGDGCDEVAVRYGTVNTALADPLQTPNGVIIVFGADPGGACGAGHLQPVAVRISGEPEVGLNSMQLGWGVTRAGKVLGDNRDFLAVSARLYPYLGVAQPTVLLFDVAQVLAKRPASGVAVVGAVGDGLTPVPVVYKERAPQLGRALWGNVDLTGDGIVDLVVSAPGANVSGDGAGAVFVFAGGPGLSGPRESVLTVVADGRERSNFGQDVSFSAGAGSLKAALGIGAPTSYRTGTANGTAFLLPLDF